MTPRIRAHPNIARTGYIRVLVFVPVAECCCLDVAEVRRRTLAPAPSLQACPSSRPLYWKSSFLSTARIQYCGGHEEFRNLSHQAHRRGVLHLHGRARWSESATHTSKPNVSKPQEASADCSKTKQALPANQQCKAKLTHPRNSAHHKPTLPPQVNRSWEPREVPHKLSADHTRVPKQRWQASGNTPRAPKTFAPTCLRSKISSLTSTITTILVDLPNHTLSDHVIPACPLH